jgi:formylglycine-generating enzyme required for sulfatase activity
MVFIEEGSFKMGCDRGDCEKDEKPVHPVVLKAFYIGKYEVTSAQWNACVKQKVCSARSYDNGLGNDKHPVTTISWKDAQQFIQWLRDITGKNYRLPTEVEWEYAARLQMETMYPWGKTIGNNYANCDGCGSKWDNKGTAPVGSFPAYQNIYDMYGNVWEWVEDCYHENYNNAPITSIAWATECYKDSNGKTSGVLRGGSWTSPPNKLRSTQRSFSPYDRQSRVYGFRVARSK